MVQFFQWVATVNDILSIRGHTPRASAIGYMWVSSSDPNEFYVIEKLRVPVIGSGYKRDDTIVEVVSKTQLRSFLVAQGETVPAIEDLRIRVRPSTPGGYYNDEVVVVDSTSRITQL